MQKNLLLKILMAPALLLAVACDQMPTEPVAFEGDTAVPLATESFTLETSKGQTALRWASPRKMEAKAAGKVGVSGGEVRLDGISLTVPKGALDETTEITIMSRAGEDVAFEFGPHGLEFNVPVQVRIDLSALENRNDIMRSAKMAYYSGLSKDASRIKIGSVSAVYHANKGGEIIEVLQTFDVFVIDGKYLEFETDHFSGYALAA
ncbi:MAG: hypothetical protein ACR2QM_01760 [Longimicrobiales bacterium]